MTEYSTCQSYKCSGQLECKQGFGCQETMELMPEGLPFSNDVSKDAQQECSPPRCALGERGFFAMAPWKDLPVETWKFPETG